LAANCRCENNPQSLISCKNDLQDCELLVAPKVSLDPGSSFE